MRANGFTLVELLVALLIFGMLSAAGVALLSFSVRAQEAADTRLGQLGDLRRASALFAADVAQAAPRLHRDGAGASRPAFIGGETALSLVRRGWENVGEERRSSLQKVEYRLAGGRLERIAYPLVDGSAPLAAAAALDGVRQFRLRFRDRRGEWRTRWDPAEATQLPVAVEMLVEAEGFAPIRQTFVAGGAG
jgi:general secretion pathway protein J